MRDENSVFDRISDTRHYSTANGRAAQRKLDALQALHYSAFAKGDFFGLADPEAPWLLELNRLAHKTLTDNGTARPLISNEPLIEHLKGFEDSLARSEARLAFLSTKDISDSSALAIVQLASSTHDSLASGNIGQIIRRHLDRSEMRRFDLRTDVIVVVVSPDECLDVNPSRKIQSAFWFPASLDDDKPRELAQTIAERHSDSEITLALVLHKDPFGNYFQFSYAGQEPDGDVNGDRSERISNAVDAIIDTINLGLRPIEAGRVHAVVPIRNLNRRWREMLIRGLLDAKIIFETDDGSADAKAANDYFLRHIRDRLTPQGLRSELGNWINTTSSESSSKVIRRSGKLDSHTVSELAAPAQRSEDIDTKLISFVIPLAASEQRHLELFELDRLNPIRARLCDIRLHFYYYDSAAIEWTAEFDGLPLAKRNGDDAEPVWYRCLFVANSRSNVRLPTNIAQVTDFIWKGRYITSPYDAAQTETYKPSMLRHIADRFGDDGDVVVNAEQTLFFQSPNMDGQKAKLANDTSNFEGVLASCWQIILDRGGITAEAEKQPTIEFELDKRARLVVSVVAAGNAPPVRPKGSPDPAATQLRPLLASLRVADPWSTKFAYEDIISERELERGMYGRFAEAGSYYLASDHCFAYLGFGDFPLKAIHTSHMPRIYRRMALFEYLNGAVLNRLSSTVSAAIENWKPDPEHDRADDKFLRNYHEIEPHLVKFSNLLWFEHLTSEIQGIELFDLMRTEGIAEYEYKMLSTEIARTDALFTSLSDKARSLQVQRQRSISSIITTGATFVAGYLAATKFLDIAVIAATLDRLLITAGISGYEKLKPVEAWWPEIAFAMMAVIFSGIQIVGQVVPGSDRERFYVRRKIITLLIVFSLVAPVSLQWLPSYLSFEFKWLPAISVAAITMFFWWLFRPQPLPAANWLIGFRDFFGPLSKAGEVGLPSPVREDLRMLRGFWFLIVVIFGVYAFFTAIQALDILPLHEYLKPIKSL